MRFHCNNLNRSIDSLGKKGALKCVFVAMKRNKSEME